MRKNNFKQSIQIGKNVTDIIRLECVDKVEKSFNATRQLFYTVFTGKEHQRATEGDWLVQKNDDSWEVVTKENYHPDMATV